MYAYEYVSATIITRAFANATPMSDLPALALADDENVSIRPVEPFRERFHLSRVIRRTLSSSYTNVLLVFVPLGIAAGTFGWPVQAVFILNFLALIPLAPLITFSIDELSLSVGHAFGELVKPTSGNAVEMIVRHLCLNVML